MRRVLLATLLSSITLTAAAAPVMHLNDDASAPTSRPVSTGVTEPRLLSTSHLNIPADELPSTAGSSATIVLHIDLDETGSPASIRVIRPVNPQVDARVIQAVRQFRWSPAVLNNQAVKTDLMLTIDVQR